MIKTLTHPIYVAAVILAVINQYIEKVLGIFIPFIHSYLDDFLCFPIILTSGLAFYRLAWPNYRLSGWHIWPLYILIIGYFEIYLPTTSTAYTADIWDALAYLLGILLFKYTLNKPTTSL